MVQITIKSLSSSCFPDEQSCLRGLLAGFQWDHETADHIYDYAYRMVLNMRSNPQSFGILESFLQRFPLTGDEGLSLMHIAEALLRIPDANTANQLITDKMNAAQWRVKPNTASSDNLLRAAGLGLLVGNKAINSPLSHAALPVIRNSIRHVVQKIGKQFVLGEDIDAAFVHALPYEKEGQRMSYDMLGEAARTQADADHYFQSYKNALNAVKARQRSKADSPYSTAGISVKLSALHPRYEFSQRDICVPEITKRMIELCRIAASANIAITIDAEETERLSLQLEIFERLLQVGEFEFWDGLGLAVQAYQKRAASVIDWLKQATETHKRNIHVRLVKGAYWDREIKHAQVHGLLDYPVFTRKCHTDLNYLICAQKMLQQCPQIYPMFATHNAHTIAAVKSFARTANRDFEFQRLHGMGEALYAVLPKDDNDQICVYAPVGPHKDLLPYLVRRMLENGANSSFINKLLDDTYPLDKLLHDPVLKAAENNHTSHPQITFPLDLFINEKPRERLNSRGLDLDDEETVAFLYRWISPFLKDTHQYSAFSLINGRSYKGSNVHDALCPANTQKHLGRTWYASEKTAEKAIRKANKAFPDWMKKSTQSRAEIVQKYADLLEDYAQEFFALLVREAGKTLPDAQAEIREAIDFCRYYANQIMSEAPSCGFTLPGPTGEHNHYTRHGRGAFICISPWNFPLAIFTGQIAAALVTGNTVIAKPAEQTSAIATFAVKLWHRAGIPSDVLNLVIGDGFIGAHLVNHPDIAGVTFTGSSEAAHQINQSLALKHGPIVPFIAETGGLNAMVVDSSALLEQVIDDVVLSAFGSAGQRCSATRLVFVQDDVADTFNRMLQGAMRELRVGDPSNISTDIGPIIDSEARANLVTHCGNLEGFGKLIAQTPIDSAIEDMGHFFAPRAYEIPSLSGIDKEVFGPVLHVLRYSYHDLDDLLLELRSKGYGLTLGIHSRIDSFIQRVQSQSVAGNIYVNRSMTGAIVGSQPFGGQGLSGTGPKAGGPDYLRRFMTERVTCTDLTATGGNASLVSLED